jgi:plasmid maintenance system antidote protein VapI
MLSLFGMTQMRFGRYFKNAPASWMNLQTRYDLEVAEDEIAAKVARDVQPLEAVTGRGV